MPKEIARGETNEAPQDALENWSNDNNVFQFIRLEDLDYDRNNARVVYVADTGRSRAVPDPATGRMSRGPSDTVGQADNGSVFKFVFNEKNPRKVDSFSVLAQGDDPVHDAYVSFVNPDNMGASTNSLMVQEDTDEARISRYDLSFNDWSVVAKLMTRMVNPAASLMPRPTSVAGPGCWMSRRMDLYIVDQGYISGPNMARSLKRGIDLFSPMPGDNSGKAPGYQQQDFAIDWEAKKVICPQGNASQVWTEYNKSAKKSGTYVRFSAACRAC